MVIIHSLLILSLCLVTNGIDYKPEEGVLELNDENFDAAVTENKILMVEFYAPWCQYCQKVKPEFIETAKRLTVDNVDIRLAAVDVDKHHDIADLYKVEWLPEFRLFIDGKVVNYDGKIESSSDFIQWLKPYHSEL